MLDVLRPKTEGYAQSSPTSGKALRGIDSGTENEGQADQPWWEDSSGTQAEATPGDIPHSHHQGPASEGKS